MYSFDCVQETSKIIHIEHILRLHITVILVIRLFRKGNIYAYDTLTNYVASW